MKPALTDILPLLNANCSDVLKAALLHAYFPDMPKLNPMWLKNPTGEVEAAFSVLKSAQGPATRTAELEAAILADHAKVSDIREAKHVDPTMTRLVQENTTARPIGEMPKEIRFEDVEPGDLVKQASLLPAVSEPLPVDTEMLSVEEAAPKFGYTEASMAAKLRKAGVKGVTKPGHRRTLFYPLPVLQAHCGVKGKHHA